MRRGTGEDQGVGAGREHVGQLVVQRAPVDEAVALVDDDGIPVDRLEAVAVLAGVLQRIDRDDHPLVIRERIAAGRDLLANALDAHRVQTNQWDGEARPQFVLELLQDVLRRDDQDAVAPAASDQLREDHPDFERLAQADGVGDEQAGLQRFECHLCRPPLVRQRVEQGVIAGREPGFAQGHRGLAQQGFEPQTRPPIAGGLVGDERGVLRAEGDDAVDVREERRFLVTDELRGADHLHHQAVGGGSLHRAHQPLLVAHEHERADGN